MDKEDICFAPAIDLAKAISKRELSPVEVAHAVIERIEALDPKLNAFAAFTPELALEAAKQAEEKKKKQKQGMKKWTPK